MLKDLWHNNVHARIWLTQQFLTKRNGQTQHHAYPRAARFWCCRAPFIQVTLCTEWTSFFDDIQLNIQNLPFKSSTTKSKDFSGRKQRVYLLVVLFWGFGCFSPLYCFALLCRKRDKTAVHAWGSNVGQRYRALKLNCPFLTLKEKRSWKSKSVLLQPIK